MTKVGKLFEEEKLEYADEKVSNIVKRMLARGDTPLEIKEVIDIPFESIKKIQTSLQIR